MSKQCRWLHNWSGWEYLDEIDAHYSGRYIGVVTKQCRTCERCGFSQTRLDLAKV